MSDLDLGATIRGFSPGQKVFNRFLLQRVLGRGGMGVVWLALDQELERGVAMKFLPDIVALDRESIAELKRETRRNLELTHPNIVRIYDFVQDASAAAISMEFIDGGSLSSGKVDRPHGIYGLAEISRWTTQLCEALSYAHASVKVVHRDLKPANLIIDSRGDLKITDFGIACSISDSVSRVSKNMNSSGTPLYMSPQQMMGERPTAADDIYSLGATLYELFTGKPPFHTGNVVLQVQNKVPSSIAARRADLAIETVEAIPAEWEATIGACLAKNPEERPASMAAIAASLKLRGSFVSPSSSGAPRILAAPAPATPPAAAAAVASTPPVAAPAPSAAPAAAPAPIASPTGRRWHWIGLAAALVVLAGAGVWAGDVPKRFQAAQRMRAAQAAVLTSDWTTALVALREASKLRPTEVEYRREYDEAQRRWLEMVQRQIQGLEPRAAYDALVIRSTAAVALVEPYSDTFRRLLDDTTRAAREAVYEALAAISVAYGDEQFRNAVQALDELRPHARLVDNFDDHERSLHLSYLAFLTELSADSANRGSFENAYYLLRDNALSPAAQASEEYAAAMQFVRETEVKHEVAAARDAAQAQRFDDARAQLALTLARGVLPQAVESAAAEVRQMAQTYSIDRLAQALVADGAADVDAAVRDYARFTDSSFTFSGAELAATKDLSTFLTALEELRLRPVAGEERTHWRDVALVAAVRSRFNDPEAVSSFLRHSYATWSRSLAKNDLPGLSLYVAGLAQKEGAPADSGLEGPARAALASSVDLAYAWAPLKVDGRPGERLRTAPLAALRAATAKALAPVLRETNSDGSGVVLLSANLSGPRDTDAPTRERGSVRYQSGTRQVDNPRFYQLRRDLNDANARAERALVSQRQIEQEARNTAQQANSAGGAALLAVVGGIGIGMAQKAYNEAYQEAENIRYELAGTPSRIDQAVFAEEPYEVITHNVTYRADFTVRTEQEPAGHSWAATLTHQTVEVAGNAARNVPVQAPVYPAASEIDAKLAAAITGSIGRLDPFIDGIAQASFLELDERSRALAASPEKTANDGWALVLLWRGAGLEPRVAAEQERRARSVLGLPAL
jgi:tRNA A-37 threonylcarbamoyl transferase component Bud32